MRYKKYHRIIRFTNEDPSVQYCFSCEAFIGIISNFSGYDYIHEVEIIFKEFTISGFMHIRDLLDLENFIMRPSENEEEEEENSINLYIYSIASSFQDSAIERKLLQAIESTNDKKSTPSLLDI
jgi:hypothetical protein